MLAGQMTKIRSLEQIWTDIWVRAPKKQKVGSWQNVALGIIKTFSLIIIRHIGKNNQNTL